MEPKKKTAESPATFVIVIVVNHSLEDLTLCLSSLDQLAYPKESFHVVLVDCRAVPGLEKVGAGLAGHDFQSTFIVLPERPPTKLEWIQDRRANEARNAAVRKVPGRYYVFTEDDCSFEPGWLHKYEAALADGVGAYGGIDILPDGMGWFSKALDCVINSFIGTAGTKRGDGMKEEWYYPRKDNMAIPAWVFERVGGFAEELIFGSEMEMAQRVRSAGLRIKFLPDNFVWHRRVTTFRTFIRRNVYLASEKVRLLREQQALTRSLHFLLLLIGITGLIIGMLAVVNSFARFLLVALCSAYMVTILSVAASSAFRMRSPAVGLGVLLLMPLHHFSQLWGVIKGTVTSARPAARVSK